MPPELWAVPSRLASPRNDRRHMRVHMCACVFEGPENSALQSKKSSQQARHEGKFQTD